MMKNRKITKMVMMMMIQEEESLNCFYKRNCVELEGMYSCRLSIITIIVIIITIFIVIVNIITTTIPITITTTREGICSRLTNWDCDRRCSGIPTLGRNILAMAGDHIVSAHCRLPSSLSA